MDLLTNYKMGFVAILAVLVIVSVTGLWGFYSLNNEEGLAQGAINRMWLFSIVAVLVSSVISFMVSQNFSKIVKDNEIKTRYLDSISFPIHVVDREMNLVYSNPTLASILGKTPQELIGKKCYDLLSNPHCNTDKCATAKAMRQDGTFTEETVVKPGGAELPIQYSGTPIKDEKGNIIGAMEQAFNISDIKSVVNEVNNTAEKLNEGHLESRVEVENAEGDYKKLVDSFNSAIENILKPVNEAINCLSAMENGDLTVSVQGDYKGDHTKMKTALNNTVDALNVILSQVAQSSDQVTAGSGQVSSASQSLSQGATEQASSLEQITSSVQEMASQTKLNSENAEKASELSVNARNSADEGNTQMIELNKAMDEISQSSQEIKKVIKVIDEIAFQTNLLALNAAVEAARAGVHGKGFAVVADEVRNLAQRSAEAARETTDLIEGSGKKVETGTSIADKTAKSLEEIVDNVNKVTELVGDIAAASKEQSEGIGQINEGLSQVEQVTQQVAANAEETASASEELSSQSVELKNMVSKFELTTDNGSCRTLDNQQDSSLNTASEGKRLEKRKDNKSEMIALDNDDFGDF
ncbi:methyl-accepting chemotaxis protein [candidate division KSB1 bacterium]